MSCVFFQTLVIFNQSGATTHMMAGAGKSFWTECMYFEWNRRAAVRKACTVSQHSPCSVEKQPENETIAGFVLRQKVKLLQPGTL